MLTSTVAILLAITSASGEGTIVQDNGPRPNRDPEAVPNGKVATGEDPVVSLSLSGVSDYRFRGISQSAGNTAVQASLEVASDNGFYVGTWASTIDAYEHAPIELDLYGGYRAHLARFDVDLGMVRYFYPGENSASSAEIYASVSRDLEDYRVKAGASYVPRQSVLGDEHGSYVFADTERQLSAAPITLRGHLGWETGVSTPTGADKIDWLLGVDFLVDKFTLSLAWVDTRYRNRRSQDGIGRNLVFAVGLNL